MFCTKCGKEGTGKFCASCGAALSGPAAVGLAAIKSRVQDNIALTKGRMRENLSVSALLGKVEKALDPSTVPPPPTALTGEVKYSYDDVRVAGSNYCDTSFVRVGAKIELMAEPKNVHDDQAVVILCAKKKIGYLPKNRLQTMFHTFRKKGGRVEGAVVRKDKYNGDIIISLRYIQ